MITKQDLSTIGAEMRNLYDSYRRLKNENWKEAYGGYTARGTRIDFTSFGLLVELDHLWIRVTFIQWSE